MKIAIGNDHAGYERKEQLKNWLIENDYEVTDLGTADAESVDYPEFAHLVASVVANNDAELGILLCGSGNGVCMTANKVPGVRAALAWIPEIAEMAMRHNNANVLCLPARYTTELEMRDIVWAYLHASFEGGRHQRRVEKIELSA
ncbi:MAG: ribose 5-phosphate isomerase B [Bacteroidota bacterium]|nr:ribose 5-phosphate isomerase B [Bacteroidota bacterium]